MGRWVAFFLSGSLVRVTSALTLKQDGLALETAK